MKPVVQLDPTGCGIAAVAAIAGVSYPKAKAVAGSLGIHADDQALWSATSHVRKLLRRFGHTVESREIPFRSWKALPGLALLSIKWHRKRGKPYWHWVVFVREGGEACVLDSKKALRKHHRTDFGRMKPKWFIPVRTAKRQENKKAGCVQPAYRPFGFN